MFCFIYLPVREMVKSPIRSLCGKKKNVPFCQRNFSSNGALMFLRRKRGCRLQTRPVVVCFEVNPLCKTIKLSSGGAITNTVIYYFFSFIFVTHLCIRIKM